MLVCHIDGWGAIVRKMNLLHYRALKITLGIERFSLGIGGYSRLLSLTNSWRLSSKLAVRIICTLARMLTLPPTNPVAAVVVSALASTEETWISAAKNLALSFNIVTIPQWSTLPSDCMHRTFGEEEISLTMETGCRDPSDTICGGGVEAGPGAH